MGTSSDRLEPDLNCRAAIVREWRKLRPRFRPRRAALLLRLLHDIHSFPHPQFRPPHSNPHELYGQVDRAFSRFVKAASELSAVLPEDSGWYVLPALMAPRTRESGHSTTAELVDIELLVRRIAANPKLLGERPPSPRGRPIASGELRLIVQAICWYMQVIEQSPVKNSLDLARQPGSRAARIIEATCAGMGLDVNGPRIFSQIRDVLELDLKAYGWWDLTQVLPFFSIA